MSASATDPRELVRALLDDDSSDGDYTNAGQQPSVIQVVEDTPRRTKAVDRSDALYIWQPADTDHGKFGAAGDEDDRISVVQVEAWTLTSAAEAENYKDDVISIVAAKRNDSAATTQFYDIYPVSSTDFRHEHNELQGNHYVYAVQFRAQRLATL